MFTMFALPTDVVKQMFQFQRGVDEAQDELQRYACLVVPLNMLQLTMDSLQCFENVQNKLGEAFAPVVSDQCLPVAEEASDISTEVTRTEDGVPHVVLHAAARFPKKIG